MKNRLRGIQHMLKSENIDAVLFSDAYSVQFFSGFSSSHAFFLVTAEKVFFFTDARYLTAAKTFFSKTDIEVSDFLNVEEWEKFFHKIDVQKLGIEMSTVSVAEFREWKKHFGIQIKDFSVEASVLRSKKTKDEIMAAKKAANISDTALTQVLPLLRSGISEKDFSWKLEKAGRDLGAEKVSFDAIVAFGENSAVPHHHPTNRKLHQNEPVLIDWGFVADSFCSDCTRCFFVGKPDDEWLEVYKKVLHAQQVGIEKMLPNASISEVQTEAEKVLCEKIPHSFGHGVGIEVHEYPTVSPKTEGLFSENMIVTAEPGLYRAGKFGIRIEDMGVIEKNGFRNLTKLSK